MINKLIDRIADAVIEKVAPLLPKEKKEAVVKLPDPKFTVQDIQFTKEEKAYLLQLKKDPATADILNKLHFSLALNAFQFIEKDQILIRQGMAKMLKLIQDQINGVNEKPTQVDHLTGELQK